MTEVAPHSPQWARRRRVVFATLSYCAVQNGYLVALGADTVLHRSLAEGAFMLAGAVVGSYVFGATWDDRNKMQHVEKLAQNGNGKERG